MTGSSVGIKDVAREAGVSITTVSHALNGKGRIPENTRRRVRGIAERLGYEPNAIARSLAGGRTGVIAIAFSLVDTVPLALTESTTSAKPSERRPNARSSTTSPW